MSQRGPHDEDTTDIDRELIANDLTAVANMAGKLNMPDVATKIGAIIADLRKPKDEGAGHS